MIYLLDTNAWIAFLNRPHSGIATRIAATRVSEIRICSVVLAELYFGAYKGSRTAANLLLIERIKSQFQSIPFDDRAAEAYGQIRAHLERAGRPIGANDYLIAAIAIANGFTVVTHNVSEFSRVPNLKIENWEATP